MGVINLGPMYRKFNINKDIIFPNGWVKDTDYKITTNGNKWEIALLKSTSNNQTIQFKHRLKNGIKVFLVAGGKNGTQGDYNMDASNRYGKGGNGGNGGGYKSFNIDKISINQQIIFKVGAAESNTSFNGTVANTGSGSGGGSGGRVGQTGSITSTENGTSSTISAFQGLSGVITLFSDYKNIKFGAGGGGGAAVSFYVGTDYPEGGYIYRPETGSRQGTGGTSGGGNGGKAYKVENGTNVPFITTGANGSANTGAGGGGGGTVGHYDYGAANGGSGGSGIILVQGFIE